MRADFDIKPQTTVNYLIQWTNLIDIALVITVEPEPGKKKELTEKEAKDSLVQDPVPVFGYRSRW